MKNVIKTIVKQIKMKTMFVVNQYIQFIAILNNDMIAGAPRGNVKPVASTMRLVHAKNATMASASSTCSSLSAARAAHTAARSAGAEVAALSLCSGIAAARAASSASSSCAAHGAPSAASEASAPCTECQKTHCSCSVALLATCSHCARLSARALPRSAAVAAAEVLRELHSLKKSSPATYVTRSNFL